MTISKKDRKEADRLLASIENSIEDFEAVREDMKDMEQLVHDFIESEHYDEDTKSHFEVIALSLKQIALMLELTKADVQDTVQEMEDA